MNLFKPFIYLRFALLILILQWAQVEVGAAVKQSLPRKAFTNSLVPLSPSIATTLRSLNSGNLNDTLEIEIPLKMRDYAKLAALVAQGQVVSQEEMDRDYLPLAADYDALVDWLTGQGFTITKTSSQRLSVFVRGTLQQIQESLQVQMGDVTVRGINYHTARSLPSMPGEIGKAVLGVNGLQPFLRATKHVAGPLPQTGNAPPYLVKEILGAYNATSLGVTGSGQKIAILIDTAPRNSDLTKFWTKNGIAQSLSNIEIVNTSGSFLSPPSGEETMDVEWSSGVAPKAKIRVYASGDLDYASLDKALQQLVDDLPSQPQLHALSISLGLGETDLLDSSQIDTDSQYFVTIANSGVSIFCSAGDDGSNPDDNGGSTGPLQVEYYASDPSVTGVGGTSLTLNTSTGAVTKEVAWQGSGGGASQVFSRPSWQKGTGVTSGTARLVPDVSLAASPGTGAFVLLDGVGQQIGGTSWSTPTWAGFSALINEARVTSSQTPLGLLNPRIYPLIGTTNFRDITSGKNGHYSAGVGYDEVTGIGVPNVSVLLHTLAVSSTVPAITGVNPLSGTVGSNVTITGVNLGGVSTVTFNGLSAQFTSVSSTQITTVVPVGATSGVISATVTNGVVTSSTTFTVVPLAPVNDNFALGTAIIGTSGSSAGNDAGASKQTGEPDHAGDTGGASVWYTWVSPASGTYTFDTYGSSFDTVLAVYTGTSVSGLTEIASNDDAGTGVTSSVSFVATAGTVYHIAVDGHGGATGSIALHWALNSGVPMVNSFFPNTGAPKTLVVINGAGFTGVTNVQFNGTPAAFSITSDIQITATVPAGVGTGVIALTTPQGTGNSAAVFTVIVAPTNDNFAKAQTISGTAGTVATSNAGATSETGEPQHAGQPGGSSLWYAWTAPVTGHYTFSTNGSSFDTLLAVYTGTTLVSLKSVAANDDSGDGDAVTSSVSFVATANKLYYIAVDGYAGAIGNMVLNWTSSISVPVISSLNYTSAPGGTSVIITGSYFTGGTSVQFNGVPASFSVMSDSQLTTTVPAHITPGPVTITTPIGTGTSLDDFSLSGTSTSSILYSTKFEPTQGYVATNPLAGQKGWKRLGVGGNGFKNGFFYKQGNQAFLGGNNPPKAGNGYFLEVWHPVNYFPVAGDIITFSVQMDIVNASNNQYSSFYWALYNTKGDNLFTIEFDNYYKTVNYYLDDNSYHPTNFTFTAGLAYNLKVTMDYGNNLWSATLDGKSIISRQPIVTGKELRSFGDMDAEWEVQPGGGNAGNDALVFDNFSITRTSPILPKIVTQPVSQTVAILGSATFGVTLKGTAVASFQWEKDGVPISGATNSSLSLTGIQATDAGQYTVAVSNSVSTILSKAAVLTVNVPTFAIATSVLPVGGGTTHGDGNYATGSPAKVVAVPADGFAFVSWTENGTVVSTSPTYIFTVAAAHAFVANFQAIP